MATNYHYGIDASSREEALNIADIQVGDELVRADWSFDTLIMRKTIWTVVKVLKTRLVLARHVNRGTVENPRIDTITLRVLVDNSTWTYTKGKVSSRIEGQSEWSRDSYYFFTPDSEKLASIEADLAERAEKRRIQREMQEAVTPMTNRFPTIEDAEKAIAALQVWAAAKKAEEA